MIELHLMRMHHHHHHPSRPRHHLVSAQVSVEKGECNSHRVSLREVEHGTSFDPSRSGSFSSFCNSLSSRRIRFSAIFLQLHVAALKFRSCKALALSLRVCLAASEQSFQWWCILRVLGEQAVGIPILCWPWVWSAHASTSSRSSSNRYVHLRTRADCQIPAHALPLCVKTSFTLRRRLLLGAASLF